jgi:TolB protein
MTTPPTFERSLIDWLEEAGAPQAPDYVDEMLARTRATRQRPAWASLERWLPMQLTLRRPILAVPRMAWLLVVLGLLIAVFVAVALGAGQHRLPPPLGTAANGLIVYQAHGRIATVNADGTDQHFLTPASEVDIVPVWSRDGTRLAFYSFPTRTDAASHIGAGPPIYDSPDKPIGSVVVMNADGTDRRVLMSGLTVSTGLVAPIAWSHDGRQLAFATKDEQANPAVDIIDLQGVDRLHIKNAGWPTWSPDDRTIAFQMPYQGVGIVPADGTAEPRKISHARGTGFAFSGPAWSPDGKRIAFYGGPDGGHDIFTVGVDGSDERVVASQPADEYWPAWSPDGKRLAFERVGDTNNDIHFVVADADGGHQVELTTPLLAGMASSWSPDGRYLIGYTFDATRLTGIMVVDVADPSKSRTFTTPTMDVDWQRIAP